MATRLEASDAPAAALDPPVPTVDRGGHAPISDELDEIVRKSHRPSRLQRLRRAVEKRLLRWLDQLVPAQAPPHDPGPPPEIRYPWF